MKALRNEKNNLMKFILMLFVFSVLTTACEEEIEGPTNENPDVELASEKAITSFVFLQSKNLSIPRNAVGQVNEASKTIKFVMPESTEIDGLIPDVETSLAASYSPTSVQDFTNPVEYTITAEDGSSVKYTVTITVEKTEREVLQAILDANPSTRLEWDLSQTVNLGDLVEVELNVQGKIEKLFLENKSISTIPSEIGNLENLEELFLSSNELTSLPSEIGNLSKLEILALSDNSIVRLPVQLWELVNLEKIFINNNSITSLPPEIGNLVRLEILYVDNNSIRSLPSEIGFLHQLSYLRATNNNLTFIPYSIANLARKNSLDIDGTNGLTLKTTDKDVLIAMDLGSDLNWSVNNYKGVSFDRERRVTEIQGQNKHIKLVPEEIGTLVNLRLMNLDENDIEELPSSLGEIKGLEVIGLSSNQLRTLPSQLGKLKNAVLMNLRNNPIESIPSAVCDLQVSNGGKLTILTDSGEGCN